MTRLCRSFVVICILAICCLISFSTETCTDLDFNQDQFGNPLFHGYQFGNNPSSNQPWSNTVLIYTSDYSNHPVRIFDSVTLGGDTIDKDLGTPNEDFGGLGEGHGGEAGTIGENSTPLGNVIIINDNFGGVTNDCACGGIITFDLVNPETLYGLSMVDADIGETDGYVELFDSSYNTISKFPLLAFGDNAYQYVYFNPENPSAGINGIKKIEVYIDGSGSIEELSFCDPNLKRYGIGDYVWWDNNRDGIQDPGEDGIEGIHVFVTLCSASGNINSNSIAHAITDENGYYYIGNLVEECYNVYVKEWEESSKVTGSDGQEYDVVTTVSRYENIEINDSTTNSNGAYLDADFGYDFGSGCNNNNECPDSPDNDCLIGYCNLITGFCELVNNDDYLVNTECGIIDTPCYSTGTKTCIDGTFIDTCEPGIPDSNDPCDGIDNDCDGSIDEDFNSQTTECGTGACSSTGNTQCINGEIEDTCTPGNAAGNDNTCDGIDGNCNGMIDEGYSGDVTTCGVGACSSNGEWICQPGGTEFNTCIPGLPSGSTETGNELCDGIDNDCDGSIDEHYISETISCGEGVCRVEYESECINGEHNEDTCVPGNPTLENDTTNM